MSDGDLLIDPAMAADGFRGYDGRDTVLDEESGTDPVCVDGEGWRGSIDARSRSRSANGADAQAVVHQRAELGQRTAQVREPRVAVEFEQVCVADAAHPPVDVLGDRAGRLRTDDAAPQRIRPDPRESQEDRPPVTRHGPIVETATSVGQLNNPVAAPPAGNRRSGRRIRTPISGTDI